MLDKPNVTLQSLGQLAKRGDEILRSVHAGITEFVAAFHQVVDKDLLTAVVSACANDCSVHERGLNASDLVKYVDFFANRLQSIDSRIRVRSLSDTLRNHAIERPSRRHFEGHDAGLDVCIRKLKSNLACDDALAVA